MITGFTALVIVPMTGRVISGAMELFSTVLIEGGCLGCLKVTDLIKIELNMEL